MNENQNKQCKNCQTCEFWNKESNSCQLGNYNKSDKTDFSKCDNYIIDKKLVHF